MSNTVRAKRKTYSLDRYRKTATKAPFPFEIDDDKTIFIARPSGAVMLDIAELFGGTEPDMTAVKEVLSALLGDSYDEVMAILREEDFGVLVAFLNDLMEYFEMGEALASLSS